jgi:peptidoglycan-associated lipoprotein
MSALTKTTPFLLAAMLIAGASACRKPAPAPQPAPAKPQAAAPAPTTDDAARKSADEQKLKADAAAEAARKAAAAEAAYKQAAAAALKDVHFAFDKSDILATDKPVLVAIADFMKAYPQARLLIDGNCDERGTVEYNLGLGERRGHAALAYLVGLGVDAKRLSSTSYGKEKPVCTDSTESCWGRNRRAHFTLQ